MSRQDRGLPGLLDRVRAAARRWWGPAPRPERRVRLQVEGLEEKVVPSTASPLAKFDGLYVVAFRGQVPVQGGFQKVTGTYAILIHQGTVTDIRTQGGGRVTTAGAINDTVNYRGLYIHIRGQETLSHGVPSGHGTWNGMYLGHTGSGTWQATRIHV
jgi:hypothetical protein